jgi:hypothetical protein
MRWLSLAAAVLLLDASLTFDNIWPTPAISWHGGVSIELAIAVLALAFAAPSPRLPHSASSKSSTSSPSRATVRAISIAWSVLVLGHYAEVTAPALYGRDINLYWDLRFVPDVVAMMTRVTRWWLIVLCAAAVTFVVALLYRIVRTAVARVVTAMTARRERQALVLVSVAAVVLFAADRVARRTSPSVVFPAPVTATYAAQVRFVAQALAGRSSVPPSPPMNSDLSRVKDADVFLVFIEAYGAVAFDRAGIADHLRPSVRRFETTVQNTGRDVVSAYVTSPTFGGSSWLAHISLLSGIEVRDPGRNAELMTEQRDTLPRAFARRGFRTVALMPGLRQNWPEGVFYGFDAIYGANQLAYRGPEFGWFAVPDQFALFRLDELEVWRSLRSPLFVFFPTISTHFPFSPTPPYQTNWSRMPDSHPYDGPDIVRAYAREPDWMNFAPGYIDAISYDLATIGGYLERHAGEDIVMVTLGDHQPAAVVSGEGASWQVPVHVIASRKPVLDRLRARGFRDGMVPARPQLGPMHSLLPLLLDAFGDPVP